MLLTTPFDNHTNKMSQQKTKANDFSILKKLFSYTKPYKWIFSLVAFLSIYISGASSLRAYISKEIINTYIVPKDYEGLLYASSWWGFSYQKLSLRFLLLITQDG